MARAMTAANVYRLPLLGAPDPDLRRGLKVAGVVGLVVLAAAYLVPKRTAEISSVDEVPDRFAKLILEEPRKDAPPAVKLPEPPKVAMEKPKEAPKPQPVPKPKEATRRRDTPKLAENRGDAGRERAKEEVAQLQEVTKNLDDVLADVTASLASTDDGKVERTAPSRRRTRGGRSASVAASASPGVSALPTAGSSAAIGGARIDVESLADAGLPAPEAVRGDGSAAKHGEIRTDAELMATVRKYAPGIQFCYDNELKKEPGLGGKLIVSVTVAADGRVTDATIVKDTVRSAALTGCALAQIQAWKFPKVAEGTVTFQAPFVFTPPE
jgi:TonB family protein